jgi:ElaB/YqjD/DUF883 family membrane-anchored ribosome-binding protein
MAKTPTSGAKTPAKRTTTKRPAKAAAKSDADKREALRGKIAAGEQRNSQRSFADQAKAAADGAFDYVKANPIKAVAGVAIGALLIGAMTRPGRRAGKKAGALASVATEAALAYGLGLMETAGNAASKGQDKLADLGETVGDKARAWQTTAAKEGSELSDYLVKVAKRSGKRAGKTIDQLRGRLSH